MNDVQWAGVLIHASVGIIMISFGIAAIAALIAPGHV